MTFLQSALSSQAVVSGVWRADWAWGVPLIIFTVVLHVLGLRLANQKAAGFVDRTPNHRYRMTTFVVVISGVTLRATILHAAEAFFWTASYGALSNYRALMLYSLGAITTYGHSGLYLEERWHSWERSRLWAVGCCSGLTAAFLFGLIQGCRQFAD